MRTEEILVERYGAYLTLEQLADMLHREPQSLRTSLNQEANALAPLARLRRKIGRRMYFRAADVAAFMEGEHA
tara:strand:- start:22 stop:240 length:219 start_codon:yes stop_codon:yes gene_type:complete